MNLLAEAHSQESKIPLYNVYVFETKGIRDNCVASESEDSLRDGKYVLCPSIDDCTALECMFMYPEASDIHLVSTVEQIESWQIDGLVHLYMHKYGTNNVIGGSYQTFGLREQVGPNVLREQSSTARETLGAKDKRAYLSESALCYCTSDQIKFITDGLDELNARKLKCRELSTETLDTIDNYKSQIEMYDQLVQLRDQYHIDRSIIGEIGWLYNIIINGTEYNAIELRYNTLMKNIKDICTKAIDLDIIQKTYYTYSPHMYFDSRVLPYERKVFNYNYENDVTLDAAIKVFEQAIYTLINREDELLFDLEKIDIEDIRDKLLYLQIRGTFGSI